MVKDYTLQDAKQWEEIVRSFERHDVYYLPGYVKAFEENGDGQAHLIYLEHAGTRAANVVMKRDVADCLAPGEKFGHGEWFDFSTPYGYGGFLAEGDDLDGVLREYEDFAKREHIVSEFVRFHPLLENWGGLEAFYDIVHLGSTVCIDTTNRDAIWDNFSSQNRNKIRKAQRAGQEVYWSRDPHIIAPFMEIYGATMDKDQADSYYYFDEGFYQSILQDLKDQAMWFYTVKDEEITAISIFMFCNGTMHYHLSASRIECRNMAPTNLLLYEAACWASENGYRRLHLGGGLGSSKDSLYEFKKGFNKNGVDCTFCIGKKIFQEEIYRELDEMRKKENPEFECGEFFPAYRSLGVRGGLIPRKTNWQGCTFPIVLEMRVQICPLCYFMSRMSQRKAEAA